MKKPHEQEWTLESSGWVWRAGSSSDLVHTPPLDADGRRVTDHGEGRLIAAAPRMARALLKVRPSHAAGCSCSPCLTIRAALREAGVLPESTGG